MALSRRSFLAHSGLVTVTVAGARFGLDVFSPLGEAAGAATLPSSPLPVGTPIMVLIDLQGGNDATNMLIDPTDPWYYDVAQGHGLIAIPEADVLTLSGVSHGLHPSMPWLASRWATDKDVAFVLGPGENVVHEFSHFAAAHYRQVADFTGSVGTGWLGRFNDLAAAGSPFASVSITGVHPTLVGAKTPVLSVPQVQYFDFTVDWRWEAGWLPAWRAMGGPSAARGTMVRASEQAIADTFTAQSKVFASSDDVVAARFDTAGLSQQLAQVAMLVNAGIPSQTYVVSLSGFDTHGDESDTQSALLAELDAALSQFFGAIGTGVRANDVFVYATSEFGRQQTANGSAGCDHGQAGVDLIVGGGARGGLYGEAPSTAPAARLDDALEPTLDFRSVYATILNHLGNSSATSTAVLAKQFEDLGIFAA